MDEKRRQEMAIGVVKGIKFQKDLAKLTEFMNKQLIETVLNAEMVTHLVHGKAY